MPELSHFDSSGQATMVDVSAKQPSRRTATASAFVEISAAVLAALPAIAAMPMGPNRFSTAGCPEKRLMRNAAVPANTAHTVLRLSRTASMSARCFPAMNTGTKTKRAKTILERDPADMISNRLR